MNRAAQDLSRSSLRAAVRVLSLINVLEFLEVRRILEPAATALAAPDARRGTARSRANAQSGRRGLAVR